MPKINFAVRLQQAVENSKRETAAMTAQMLADLFSINMREIGHLNEDKVAEILEETNRDYDHMIEMWNSEWRENGSADEAIEKLEAKLRKLCPKRYIPFAERYAGITMKLKGR